MSKLNRITKVCINCTFLLLIAQTSHAYIGPGMGFGTIMSAFAFLGALFVAMLAIVFYPVKRLFQKLLNLKDPSKTASNNRDR